MGKVNQDPKGIGLENIFRNFLQKKKKKSNFNILFLYFL